MLFCLFWIVLAFKIYRHLSFWLSIVYECVVMIINSCVLLNLQRETSLCASRSASSLFTQYTWKYTTSQRTSCYYKVRLLFPRFSVGCYFISYFSSFDVFICTQCVKPFAQPLLLSYLCVCRNEATSRDDFIFYSKRLMRILIEHALSHLPFKVSAKRLFSSAPAVSLTEQTSFSYMQGDVSQVSIFLLSRRNM